MKTVLASATSEVVIGVDSPFVVIGERINPTGRKVLAAELRAGQMDRVIADAVAQVEAGAAMLDVNAGLPDVDEVDLLVRMVQTVEENTEVPLSIDSSDPAALAAALSVCQGKPLVNSVTGEEDRLAAILPLVERHGAAVIGLAHDEAGPSMDPAERLEVARKIVDRAADHGIAAADVVIDPLAMTVGAEPSAAKVALDTIRLIRRELGNNLTLGASNVSFGLPRRQVINRAFLVLATGMGLSSAIANPLDPDLKPTLLATDLLLVRDPFGSAWIREYRQSR